MKFEVSRRPALTGLLGLIIGLTSVGHPLHLLFLLGLVGVDRWPARIAFALAFFVGAMLGTPGSGPVRLVDPVPLSGPYSVVTAPTPRPGGEVCLIEGALGRIQLLLETPEDSAGANSPGLNLGDEVLVDGVAKPVPEASMGFAEEQGVVGEVVLKRPKLTIIRAATGIAAWGGAWRRGFRNFLQARVAPADAGIVGSIVFNDNSALTPQTKKELSQSGIVVLLAASGLHLTMLGRLLDLITRPIPLPFLFRRGVTTFVLALFAAAGGFHAGAIRALTSSVLRGTSYKFGRSFDALSSVGLFGIGFLLWQPQTVYQPGFHLAVIIGGAFAAFESFGREEVAWKRTLKSGVVAWGASVPLIAQEFGVVSLIGLPINFLAGFALPIAFLGSLGAYATSGWLAFISAPLLALGASASRLLYGLVSWSGHLPFWGLEVGHFSGYWLLPIYLLPLMYRRAVPRRAD